MLLPPISPKHHPAAFHQFQLQGIRAVSVYGDV